MKTQIAALSAAVLASLACFGDTDMRARQAALRTDLVGCYRLLDRDGSPLDSSKAFNAFANVELTPFALADTGRYPGTRGVFFVRQPGAARPDSTALAFGPSWSVDSVRGILEVSFVDGFSGAVVTLRTPRAPSDTMRGWVEEHWDFGPSTSNRRRASAIRVQCPANSDSARNDTAA
jgi:hypothetical protein